MKKDKTYFIDLITKHCYGAYNNFLLLHPDDLEKLAEKLASQLEPLVMQKIAEGFCKQCKTITLNPTKASIHFCSCCGKKLTKDEPLEREQDTGHCNWGYLSSR